MDIELITNNGEVEQESTSPKEEKDFTDKKFLELNPKDINPKILKFLLKDDAKSVSNLTVLKGDITPSKCGYNNMGKFFITPYGGPTLTEGDPVPNNKDFIITKIHYVPLSEKYLLELSKKEVK